MFCSRAVSHHIVIYLWFTYVLFYSIHGGKRTFQFHSFSLIRVQKRKYSPFYSLHSYFRSFVAHTVYLLRPQTLYILHFSWFPLKLRIIGSAPLFNLLSWDTYTYQAGYTYVTYVVIILILTRVFLVKKKTKHWAMLLQPNAKSSLELSRSRVKKSGLVVFSFYQPFLLLICNLWRKLDDFAIR